MRIITFFLLLLCLTASSQTQTVYRRVTGGTATIPDNTHVQGQVSSGSPTTTLTYVGAASILQLFPAGSIGTYGNLWIYLPAVPVVAKVMNVVQTSASHYTFTLDRAISGQTNDSLYLIKANVTGYSFINDSTADGSVNGVTVKAGVMVSMPYSAITGTGPTSTAQEPVYLDATNTGFFIVERHTK